MTDAQRRLIDLLQNALDEYGYCEAAEGPAGGIPFVARLATASKKKPQYVCAVVEAPPGLRGIGRCQVLVERVRDFLSGQPPRAIFKGRGTYLVLLCSHELFEELCDHERTLIDRTGLHRNVLLGTCLVDAERLECSGASTWGLFHSGRHYGAVKATVLHWCGDARAAGEAPEEGRPCPASSCC